MLTKITDALGLTDPWTFFAVFLGASLLMLWRLEAMLKHGLEGTALGTLVMPYCSGLGNLLFVFIMVQRGGAAKEVLTNSIVNNVTNLTLLLGLPAVFWGLAVVEDKSAGSSAGKAKRSGTRASSGVATSQINRLSLLLSLTAVIFFTGAVWLLGRDGTLSRTDGLVLIGLFLFWQSFQLYDVMKYNIARRASFGFLFYIDAAVLMASAWLLYASLDWLVAWLTQQKSGFVSVENLGWLSGWLMVLPNALLAFYWAGSGGRKWSTLHRSETGTFASRSASDCSRCSNPWPCRRCFSSDCCCCSGPGRATHFSCWWREGCRVGPVGFSPRPTAGFCGTGCWGEARAWAHLGTRASSLAYQEEGLTTLARRLGISR